MTRGVFLSEEEVLDLFSRLDRLESLLRERVKEPVAADRPTLVNRLTAAYYISTGRLPDDIDNPPRRGLTRFDELVNSGDIACIPSGTRKKLFRVADLDQFIYRHSEKQIH